MNTLERFIEKHADWWWDIHRLSRNPSITPKFIEKYPDGNPPPGWRDYISIFPSCCIKWKWDICQLSRNPSITPDFVIQHADWEWNTYVLSQNYLVASNLKEHYPNYHPPSGWIGGKNNWKWDPAIHWNLLKQILHVPGA